MKQFRKEIVQISNRNKERKLKEKEKLTDLTEQLGLNASVPQMNKSWFLSFSITL